MNAVTVFNAGNLPAFAKKGELSAVAKALAGGGGGSGKRISIKGGVFRLMADGKEVAAVDERHLDIVVVNAAPKVHRTFYIGTYDENKVAAPTCWSQDGEKPDSAVAAPQHSNCANCPQNAKGSGQGETRACRYNQRVAVVLADDMEGDVLQLQLPATSIFGKAEGDNRPLQEYARWLSAQGIDPTMLVTRLKFDTKSATPKLFFKPMRWLTDEEFTVTQEKGNSPDALKAITLTVSQVDGVQPIAAPTLFGGVAPKAKSTTVVAEPAEEEEPPAPAPKVRATKTKTAAVEQPVDEPVVKQTAKPQTNVPAAAGLAATLAEWDDE